jgi:hypothetical protein
VLMMRQEEQKSFRRVHTDHHFGFLGKEMNVAWFYVRSLLNPGRRVTNVDAATVWFVIAIVSIVLLAILPNIMR